jgi:hypothetical protein
MFVMTYLHAPAQHRFEIHGVGNLRRLGSEACPDAASSDETVGKVIIFGFSSVGCDLASWVCMAGVLSRTLRVLTSLF